MAKANQASKQRNGANPGGSIAVVDTLTGKAAQRAAMPALKAQERYSKRSEYDHRVMLQQARLALLASASIASKPVQDGETATAGIAFRGIIEVPQARPTSSKRYSPRAIRYDESRAAWQRESSGVAPALTVQLAADDGAPPITIILPRHAARVVQQQVSGARMGVTILPLHPRLKDDADMPALLCRVSLQQAGTDERAHFTGAARIESLWGYLRDGETAPQSKLDDETDDMI